MPTSAAFPPTPGKPIQAGLLTEHSKGLEQRGLTEEPVTATRIGCKPLAAPSPSSSSIARSDRSMSPDPRGRPTAIE